MKLLNGSTTMLGSALALLIFSRPASGQHSCVQAVDATFSGCPCDAAEFSFSIIREMSLAKNTVNLAVVVDGSGSIDALNGAWELEKDFAKSTAAAFADRNLFINGGSASYVQYSNSALETNSGTFHSLEEFESHVDADDIARGRTSIGAGIELARSLLTAAPPASAAFMIVITDADHPMRFLPLPKEQADAAREEGVEVFAVGIGDFSGVGEAILEEIGGNTDRVFQADNFQALNELLDEILVESSIIACEATDATLEIEFSVPIADVSHPTGASFFDNVAILPIGDITSDETDFVVQLETCMLANDIIRAITEVSYSDDQGNNLDVSSLLDADEVKRCTTGPNPAPSTPAPTPSNSPDDGNEAYDCSVCSNLTEAQEEVLARYDNGGKKIVCDPTCLDGVTDPIGCNYFDLGQVCRGCGNCSACTPCPDDQGHDEYDCSVCSNLTEAQEEVLARYDNGGKKIVCDPSCLDDFSDPIGCNYFGLGKICRGCGDCSLCTPCP